MNNRKSLAELAENIFCSVLLLPDEIQNSPEEIKKDFAEKIKEFCNDCTGNGYAAGEIENAKYALCAWIDEYIYANCNISSQWFSHSLVLSEFQDAEAGRHFFERMESFHKNKDSAPLLELYAKCILFGFMGKFRMGDTAELKQTLNSAISKTDMFLEQVNFKPATKNRHKFSFRRAAKNILITGSNEAQCKDLAKKQNPPEGYKYVYSDMKNIEELPFIDGIISINSHQPEFTEKLFSKQKCKIPVYAVADLEIPEFEQTLDKNYEFNSEHLNYYLHKHFLDNAACKNILSLPKKLGQFKNSENFYTMPFFPFMKNEKPLAYSLTKKVLLILFLASAILLILSFIFSGISKHKEEIKNEGLKLIERNIKLAEDSLNLEFEKNVKNLELHYQKKVFEKFPFKEGKTPSVAEVSDYFSKDGEFYKFIDIIDTISDSRIKFNKKALTKLLLLKNNTWSDIPVSIIVKAPKTAAVDFFIDSQYVEIERGKNKIVEIKFPQKSEIKLIAKTANNVFEEKFGGEWGLLKIQNKHEFSFIDKSYLIDVELNVHWHLPKNAIEPKKWFELRLEPNLTENFPLTHNLGE